MREHAIPQDITGYRFHIIGNMTIKQFAELGAGALLGFLIYTTNLPIFFKWPLIFLMVGLGAMAAFVPIEERPLDHWIVTFFKILYKPTTFFWRRTPKIPEPFLFKPSDEMANNPPELDLRPARRERIKEYLRSVETPNQLNVFDQAEFGRLNSIMDTFGSVAIPLNQVVAKESSRRPNLKIRVRSLIVQTESTGQSASESWPNPELTNNFLATEPLDGNNYVYQAPELTPATPLDPNQVAGDIQIPEVVSITYQTQAAEQPPTTLAPEAVAVGVADQNQDDRTYMVNTTVTPDLTSTQVAVTNAALPFPDMPTEPNRVVGMVLRQNQELINDAIVEIQTADGRVVRAVKSNALGQFFISTPLDPGVYTLQVERDGFQFIPQQLTVDGSVLAPLEIRSIS